MGSKLQFETTVLETSKQCKTFATKRILISHPVQVLWGFENEENISPHSVQITGYELVENLDFYGRKYRFKILGSVAFQTDNEAFEWRLPSFY